MAELTLKKLKQLFSSVAQTKQPQPELDYREYNWKKPHRFRDDHQEDLNEFSNLVIKNIAFNFSEICHCKMKAEIKDMDQHYASILINDTLQEQNDLFLRFSNGNNLAGFIRIPIKTAMAWVVHMLGDNEIDPNKKNTLSMLEESLLIDICKNAITGLSNSLVAREANPVEPEDALIKDKLTLSIDQMQELYEIAFEIISPENVISDASIYIFSNHIDKIAGYLVKETTKADAAKIDQARQNNLSKLCLPVNADLGQLNISLSDLVSLQPGDVVKLDITLNSNVMVKIKEKPAFKAWPVKNNGKISLLIDETKEF